MASLRNTSVTGSLTIGGLFAVTNNTPTAVTICSDFTANGTINTPSAINAPGATSAFLNINANNGNFTCVDSGTVSATSCMCIPQVGNASTSSYCAGTIWYNTNTCRFNYAYCAASPVFVWTSRNAMVGSVSSQGTVTGTSTSTALGWNGYSYGQFQKWDGTDWSFGPSSNFYCAYRSSAGTANSSLLFGGFNGAIFNGFTCTEEYNGTSWSAGGNMINQRFSAGGAGTQNTALVVSGLSTIDPSATFITATEKYNGTSWSATGAVINAFQARAVTGESNSALAFGGWNQDTGCRFACTEKFNGTSWSTGNAMIIARRTSGAGTQNSALAIGGYSPSVGETSGRCVESYNGTTWSTYNALINSRNDNYGAFGSNNSNNAGIAGGDASQQATEILAPGLITLVCSL